MTSGFKEVNNFCPGNSVCAVATYEKMRKIFFSGSA